MSIKALHREIMRSAVYQLSADHQAAAFAKDGGNRLYWRANRHRMSAEQIRDSVLFVSGALDARMGGPSVPLTPLADRRTVYGKRQPLQARRVPAAVRLPEPEPDRRAALRDQRAAAAAVLHEQRLHAAARRAAGRDASPTSRTTGARIEKAYRLIFGRAPTADGSQGRARLPAGRGAASNTRSGAPKAKTRRPRRTSRRRPTAALAARATSPTERHEAGGDAGAQASTCRTAMMAGVVSGREDPPSEHERRCCR